MPDTLIATPGWALVQGASRGIGYALVEALLSRVNVLGVVATSRRPHQSSTLADLSERFGPRLITVPLDVEAPSSIEAAAREVSARLPEDEALRIVINSTGLLHDGAHQPEKRLENVEAEALARAFAVNATGPILVAQQFMPLIPKEGPSVFASLSARVGSISDNRLGGWYAYRASKAAQNMLTKTLAIEWARRLPECICVGLHPGTVDTQLSAPFRSGVSAQALFSPTRAAGALLDVLGGLDQGDSGSCFAWDGQRIEP
ncbi:MAG: SDR family NAD(P)-dependent oxidoreductase [Pseudomonadota bacterium]